MDVSLCPWYIELNYNKLRYPSILMNAKCKCPNCIGIKKHGSKPDERKCESITIKEKVLRRDLTEKGTPKCEDGKASYVETWEDVPIACSCVIRSTTEI